MPFGPDVPAGVQTFAQEKATGMPTQETEKNRNQNLCRGVTLFGESGGSGKASKYTHRGERGYIPVDIFHR